jgi:ribosomal-protein-alanine N-acetyltransferase
METWFAELPDLAPVQAVEAAPSTAVVSSDWRTALPVLTTGGVILRELTMSDAPALLAMLNSEEVRRFISPPPTTIEGFEAFIAWTHREREAGRGICFGIVPRDYAFAIGIIQLRQTGGSFLVAEWGFALGSAFWSSGIFMNSARAVLDFAFEVVGVQRLEARACTANGRGNGALRKLGAVIEGTLRESFLHEGVLRDQYLWAILASGRGSGEPQASGQVH